MYLDFDVNDLRKVLFLCCGPLQVFKTFLGGAVSNVKDNATSVHPAMRKAAWQIETFDERLIQKLRDEVKDTGAGYNHASKNEPDWLNAFWGNNLPRLEELKKKYDSENRMNCWHCIGYRGKDGSKPSSGSRDINIVAFIVFLGVFTSVVTNFLTT